MLMTAFQYQQFHIYVDKNFDRHMNSDEPNPFHRLRYRLYLQYINGEFYNLYTNIYKLYKQNDVYK